MNESQVPFDLLIYGPADSIKYRKELVHISWDQGPILTQHTKVPVAESAVFHQGGEGDHLSAYATHGRSLKRFMASDRCLLAA